MRNHRPRNLEPDKPEPTLHDVMQCLVIAQEERRWIMASVIGVMRHLGMDNPSFPRAGLVVPPPSQAWGIGHDGTGTSGTHPKDTDDDSDEGTEAEEAEYVFLFLYMTSILLFIYSQFSRCIGSFKTKHS